HAGSLAEAAREADKGACQQRGTSRLVQVQELPHLAVQARIGEGGRRQLITEKILDDIFCIGDRIQHFRHRELTLSEFWVYGTAEEISLQWIPEQIDG